MRGGYNSFIHFNYKKGIFYLFLILPFLFIPVLKSPAFVIFLVSINAIFSFFSRPLRRFSLGIELTTFFTVICALKFGSFWGGVIGLLMIIAEYIGSMRASVLAMATIPSIMIIGFIAPYFASLEIAVAGLILSVLYNLFSFMLCFFIRRRVVGLVIFAITNIIINKLLFTFLGPFFV